MEYGLAAVPRSVISHASAARWLGWEEAPQRVPEVLTTFTGNARVGGVTVHRTRSLPEADVLTWRGRPCTTGARTTLDLAATIAAPRVPALVDGMVWSKATTVGALRRRVELPGGSRRNRPAVARLVGPEGAHSVRSELERRLPLLCAAQGLPRPLMNQPLTIGGRTLTPDATWPGTWVLAELLGLRFHSAPDQVEQDALRHATFAAAGYHVLTLTWHHLVVEPEIAARLIRQALAGAPAHS